MTFWPENGGISALEREAVYAGRRVGWGALGDRLTEVQPLPGEFPLAGIIRQVFTLLLQRHLPGVHDDGQVARLDVCVGWLGWRWGQLIDLAIPQSWVNFSPGQMGSPLGLSSKEGTDGLTTSGCARAQHGGLSEASQEVRLPGEPGRLRTLVLILQAVQGERRPHKERLRGSVGGGALTLLMLQKMKRRRIQKKTAMTPVPTRITISMLPLSSEPEWTERG